MVECKPLDEWWNNYVTSYPAPLDMVPIDPVPWWMRWKHDKSAFLEPVDYPETKMDVTDVCYLAGRTSKTAAQKMAIRIAQATEKRRLEAMEAKERALAMRPTPKPTLRGPKANVYLRRACEGDIKQIVAIYNHSVQHGWVTSDRQVVSEEEMEIRFNRVTENNLPWLVAVEKNDGFKHELFIPGRWAGKERVVGYAFAEDHVCPSSGFRFTAEVEVYVLKEMHNRAIGTSLIDRVLFTLDVGYAVTTDCPWFCNDRYEMAGQARPVHRLLMNCYYAPDDESDRLRSLWLQAMLDRFGFEKAGEIDGIACRHGKR